MRGLVIRILGIAVFLLVLSVLILYAKGYRLNKKNGQFNANGIIAIHSQPKAAKVYINDKLKGVSDLNLTLLPDKYTIKVSKAGYTDWTKTVKLEPEVVLSFNALLFPKNPSLSPLTNIGVVKAIPIDQTDKILVFSQKNKPKTDGIYIFETNKTPISFNNPLKQILLLKNLPLEQQKIDLKETSVMFSPNYDQFILTTGDDHKFLLSVDQKNTELSDITSSAESLISAWQEKENTKNQKIIETFPKEIQKIASDSFHIISLSPNKLKVLYQAKESITIPKIIKKTIPGINQEPQQRTIVKGAIYVYDEKEDLNFLIKPVSWSKSLKSNITDILRWHPDSTHLFEITQKSILAFEYDGTNKTTVYSGPFENNFFNLTSDGELIITANLNPKNNLLPDLYLVGIK